jgi:hypothetical protein
MLDLILWGATGFTGSLATAYLAGDASKFFSCGIPAAAAAASAASPPSPPYKIRYGLAGRSRDKLEALKQACGCAPDVPIFVAEADDDAAIAAFVRRARVVCSLAGPFVKYSDRVVRACAETGTDYVDITGEVPWVRSLMDRFHDRAVAQRAAICNMCGFDSLPFELGALFGVAALRRRHGPHQGVASVTAYVLYVNGGFSGGSLATGMLQQTDPVHLSAGVSLADPFLLGGVRRGGPRAEDADEFLHTAGALLQSEKRQPPIGGGGGGDSGDGGGLFVGPSTMHPVNSRVVRKAAGALGWGERFRFAEQQLVPSEKLAQKLLRNATHPAGPEVIRQLMEAGKLPKPGEGALLSFCFFCFSFCGVF